ncbi:dehydrin DHN3-like [Cucurbita pepo subsp. pepo]|uniref:dehydrin DHN3-like n=1 Tax=Cucurbita pepo subsp. pepo TaxID=3664 RepID=UPI000C9D8003|nr:dehydrin DHN3-like [Cucurbita pepo subsp. pepo]
MAHYQNQYSAQSGADQYGNPIRQTDEYGNVISDTAQHVDPLRRTDEFRGTDQYGNPIHRTDQHGVGDPTGRTGTGTGTGMYEGGGGGQQQQQRGGMFHHDKPVSTGGSVGYTTGEQGERHEKKGMMEKIKEKLPGGNQ